MERPEDPKYDFNEPLLSKAFDVHDIKSGFVVVALLFLSAGPHAGPGGDIECILEKVKANNPNLEVAVTSPIGSHSILTDTLTSRYFEAIKDW